MKTVIVGVTGGIAAYKSCEIVSALTKLGYGVRVVMTKNATEFVTPLTFETLSKNRVVADTFDKEREFEVEHISYSKLADAFLIAPATENFIGKYANGVADDMLTTTVSACTCPVIVCPAMNTNMYLSPANQKNMEMLRERGVYFVEAEEGILACGDAGKGRLADPKKIVSYVDALLTPNPDYRGKTVVVTAGATEEPVDGVRFLTNRSSGKMGLAIAEACAERGGNVILVAGRMKVPPPKGMACVQVTTTEQMCQAVLDLLPRADIIVKAAAPADYRVKNPSKQKLKADTLTLEFVKNPDIAMEVGKRKGNKKLLVFAAETEDLLQNAAGKLRKKNADMIVANDVTLEGAGFDGDTNIATIITADGKMLALEKMTKRALADVILDELWQV